MSNKIIICHLPIYAYVLYEIPGSLLLYSRLIGSESHTPDFILPSDLIRLSSHCSRIFPNHKVSETALIPSSPTIIIHLLHPQPVYVARPIVDLVLCDGIKILQHYSVLERDAGGEVCPEERTGVVEEVIS